jgi:hypothetical protein
MATTIPAARADAVEKMRLARQSGFIVNPDVIKHAELSGTSLMPNQPEDEPVTPAKAVVKKTASVGRLVQGKERHSQREEGEQLEENSWVQGKQQQAKQHKQLEPHINVQGAEPPSETKLKVSSYALLDRYPLDNYAQVKTAAIYFDANWQGFTPYQRHLYCSNMVKRADELCIPVSDMARKYGSATYAPAEDIEVALSMRRSILPEQQVDLLDKLAATRPTIPPELFACALEEFDKVAGLHHYYDQELYDSFYSTFGFVKQAEYSETIGTEYINESRLKELAISGYAFIKRRFGEDLADEFRKDPVGIFKSLPLEQKTVIMRVAGDQQPTRGES